MVEIPIYETNLRLQTSKIHEDVLSNFELNVDGECCDA